MRSLLSILALMLFATPAIAQDSNFGDDVEAAIETAEGIYESQCVQQGIADGQQIDAANKRARQACASLRNCKKQCRGAKKSAKKANRAKKKDCKKACKGKKGKAKRECKKQCRKSARSGRKGARHAKKGCIRACRSKHKTPACKAARKAVVTNIGKAVANLFNNRKDCETQVNAAIDAVNKADQAENTAN